MKYKSILTLFVSIIMFCLISLSCFAQTSDTNLSNVPLSTPSILDSCQQGGFDFLGNILNLNNSGYQYRIFLLHNISPVPLILEKYNSSNSGAMGAAGWATKIAPGNWAALSMTQQNFKLSCRILYSNLGFRPCQSLLSVCSFTPKKPGVGGFWLSENATLFQISNVLKQRRILD